MSLNWRVFNCAVNFWMPEKFKEDKTLCSVCSVSPEPSLFTKAINKEQEGASDKELEIWPHWMAGDLAPFDGWRSVPTGWLEIWPHWMAGDLAPLDGWRSVPTGWLEIWPHWMAGDLAPLDGWRSGPTGRLEIWPYWKAGDLALMDGWRSGPTGWLEIWPAGYLVPLEGLRSGLLDSWRSGPTWQLEIWPHCTAGDLAPLDGCACGFEGSLTRQNGTIPISFFSWKAPFSSACRSA